MLPKSYLGRIRHYADDTCQVGLTLAWGRMLQCRWDIYL